ncbi:MAG: hypothetical protein Q3M30_16405 [Candidatus Electrothrix sp. Rat3]|nr:hypothetical protein [Candidatus Electrothrix rattekaaiensis]
MPTEELSQLTLFPPKEDPVRNRLKEIDPDELTNTIGIIGLSIKSKRKRLDE